MLNDKGRQTVINLNHGKHAEINITAQLNVVNIK